MTRLHIAHIALDFTNRNAQHTEDITRVFERAKEKDWAWITGTEAGTTGNTGDELRRIGTAHGYLMWVPTTTDSWIAVHRSLIEKDWAKGYDPVIPASHVLYLQKGLTPAGKPGWGPRGLVWVAFNTLALGKIYVGAAHYLLAGRQPGVITAGINHWEWNRKLGTHVGEWAQRVGKGSALVFFGADTNMRDDAKPPAYGDVFFGQPLTSAWDELEHWEDTGHGPIDVIASYNADDRTSAISIHAFNDTKFPLHTDHFLVEADYEVKPLVRAQDLAVEHLCPTCGKAHRGIPLD